MKQVKIELTPEQATDADLLAEERHARRMDAAQYTARIAELERELADAKAAVPDDDVIEAVDTYLQSTGMAGYYASGKRVQAWLDAVYAQRDAQDAASRGGSIIP